MAFSSPKWSDSSFHPNEIITPTFIAICIFPFVLLQFPAIILSDMWIYTLGKMISEIVAQGVTNLRKLVSSLNDAS